MKIDIRLQEKQLVTSDVFELAELIFNSEMVTEVRIIIDYESLLVLCFTGKQQLKTLRKIIIGD